jgi:hypothetical protein
MEVRKAAKLISSPIKYKNECIIHNNAYKDFPLRKFTDKSLAKVLNAR